MDTGDEHDFQRYLEERHLQSQYYHQEEVFHQHKHDVYDVHSSTEIEDEDFSKLSIADPGSDSEDFLQMEGDVNPWSKEDNFKRPPKYAVDFRKLYRPVPALNAPKQENIELADENMTESDEKSGENHVIHISPLTEGENIHEITNEIPKEHSSTSLETTKEKPPTIIIEGEKQNLTGLHWLGVTSFIVAVFAVLTLTFFNLYQTAQHS